MDRDSNGNSNEHTYRNANFDANWNADRDTDRNTYGDPNWYADGDTDNNANDHSDSVSNLHPDMDSDSWTYKYADTASDEHAYADDHPNADDNEHLHGNTDRYANAAGQSRNVPAHHRPDPDRRSAYTGEHRHEDDRRKWWDRREPWKWHLLYG
jgi:hypothetical protein